MTRLTLSSSFKGIDQSNYTCFGKEIFGFIEPSEQSDQTVGSR